MKRQRQTKEVSPELVYDICNQRAGVLADPIAYDESLGEPLVYYGLETHLRFVRLVVGDNKNWGSYVDLSPTQARDLADGLEDMASIVE